MNLFLTNFDLLDERLYYLILLVAKFFKNLLVIDLQLANLLLRLLYVALVLLNELFVLVTKLKVLSSNLLRVPSFFKDLNVEVDKQLLFLSLL